MLGLLRIHYNAQLQKQNSQKNSPQIPPMWGGYTPFPHPPRIAFGHSPPPFLEILDTPLRLTKQAALATSLYVLNISVAQQVQGSSIKNVRAEGEKGVAQCGQKQTRGGGRFLLYFVE